VIKKLHKIKELFTYKLSMDSMFRGFTFIELLAIFSIIAVLSTFGFVSYTSYTNSQVVQSAATDVFSFYNSAKSESLSQVKPTQCGAQILAGYKIVITMPTQYKLYVVCGANTYIIASKNLPTGISFGTGSTQSVQFNIITGTSNIGTITITGFGKSHSININASSEISLQ